MGARELAAGLEAASALRATSTDGLLTSFAALTHRMHEYDLNLRSDREAHANFRAQRDLIRAEILRRTGDL